MSALTVAITAQIDSLLESNMKLMELLTYARRYEPSEIAYIQAEIDTNDFEIKNLRLALDAASVWLVPGRFL